ncbi:hypothetical protein FY036_05665 [Mesorhizobium microcysteis]|uniref:Fenitrothion hydrolase n=1 Tax=Neoaquamicrobium microcysteis TaxID=2682781 RepID=A0A5D4GYT6_9HYPH|nr:hypothetical protein FY036_05665 [Mesorhizobium microcysteis]
MRPAGRWGIVFGLAGPALFPAEALAHAADRGHVLLLPTGYYLLGGAAAVALTFLALAFMPPSLLEGLARVRLAIGSVPTRLRMVTSAATFLLLIGLVTAGILGSRDPLSNPLPLVFWTVFWIGLTLLQGVVGNLWWWINPLYAPWRALTGLTGHREGFVPMPDRLGYWPAVALFFGFAWFELVYLAPDDPARLATVVTIYFSANLVAALAFGYEEWTRRGECLSVFLGMIARLAIVEGSKVESGRRRIALCLPGAKLVSAEPLPPSGTLFLLLALSTVSFDGLMRTFLWLGLFGVNPLEFPGRSAVTGISSFGLLATFVVLGAAFHAAVALGERLAGASESISSAAGALVWSIIPISMAYHFSHYLTSFVINGQYALAALSDPLMSGADLFGTAGMHVQAGMLMGAERAWLVWNLQAAAIVGGHLLAVLVAHAVAFRLYGSADAATRSQVPLAVLMVLYTVFGLWLLSSPTAA